MLLKNWPEEWNSIELQLYMQVKVVVDEISCVGVEYAREDDVVRECERERGLGAGAVHGQAVVSRASRCGCHELDSSTEELAR